MTVGKSMEYTYDREPGSNLGKQRAWWFDICTLTNCMFNECLTVSTTLVIDHDTLWLDYSKISTRGT